MKQLSDWLASSDVALLRYIHHNRIAMLDDFLYWFSFTTTFVSISIILTVLALSIRNKSGELRIKFFKLVLLLTVCAITSWSLKYFIGRERPFVHYTDIVKLSEAGNSSFPSGHTLEAFAFAFAVSFLFPHRRYIILVVIWAILIGYSRIALGVHYPSDVIGGIITGFSICYLTFRIFDLPVWRRKVQ